MADLSLRTPWKVAELQGAFRAGTTFHTRGTFELAVDKIQFGASFLVFVALADLGIRTAGKVTELQDALRTRAALHARGAVELTVDQSSCCASLRSDVFVERGLHTCRKVTEYRSAFGSGAALTTGTLELTVNEMGLRASFVAAW